MKTQIILVLCLAALLSGVTEAGKLNIAHRGASGYLPEHSIAAKAMAAAMGADYIEQDLVMTRDNQLVVLHDHYLDRVTDVAEKFPGRQRQDGRFYVIDFTLDEIRRLKMSEGFKIRNSTAVAKYPSRFPLWESTFKVHTFAEEIELIQGLNHSMGKNIGIYPEIKSPWFHRAEGKDISSAVLKTLKRYGYDKKTSKVFLQCFDPNELKTIKTKLMPELGINIKLVQLIAMSSWQETRVLKGREKGKAKISQAYNYDWMLAPGAMKIIAQYADGIGPWFPMLVQQPHKLNQEGHKAKANHMVAEAQQYGLQVHPYTFRSDPGQVPKAFSSFEQFSRFYLEEVGVDGVFTDFPDRIEAILRP